MDVDAVWQVLSSEVNEVDAPEALYIAKEVPQERGRASAADLKEGVVRGYAHAHLPLKDIVGVDVVAVDAVPEAVCQAWRVSHDEAMSVAGS